MTDTVPAPLATMRAITGTLEASGSADNPVILAWADVIARAFPEMAGYARRFIRDSIAWCGHAVAYCMAMAGIKPPYSPGNDLGSYLWSESWASWGTPVEPGQEQPGDVLIFNTPHHVTLYEGQEGGNYVCRGGNQSDSVNVSRFAKSGIRAIRRPPAPTIAGATGPTIPISGTLRPEIKFGDTGPYVVELQKLLGIEADGEFGPDTDAAVRTFQATNGLVADGEVGEQTWPALLGSGGKITPVGNVPHAAEYADAWRRMTILPEHASELDAIARKLIGNKQRYQAAVAGIKVPWFFIAVIHQRESTANFSKNIHNGEALNKITTLVPAGRGPFSSFEESVNDWIALKGLNKITDWPIERFAYQCELNNGMGYRNRGVPSAYLWSFSNIYRGGKYIADHVWSATAMDQQCGTMPLLKQMMALDASITFAAPPLDGEILPPAKIDDELLRIILAIILSEETTTMDEKLRALLVQSLTSPTQDPNLRARLLEALGEKPAPPPVQPPPPLTTGQPALDGFDFAKLGPLLQHPTVQKLFSGKAVTIVELLPLIMQAAPLFGVRGVPLLPAPTSQDVNPVPPATTDTTPAIKKPSVQLSTIALGIVSVLQAIGVVGTPFGMGQAPTDTGTLATLTPIITGLVGTTGAWGAIANIGLKLLGGFATKFTAPK
jgi:uncharacterized protein (TIGR02594 family)